MRLIIAAVLTFAMPVQAMALSCIPPSVERSFGYAQEAEEPYVVVTGRVNFDERTLPKTPKNQ